MLKSLFILCTSLNSSAFQYKNEPICKKNPLISCTYASTFVVLLKVSHYFVLKY